MQEATSLDRLERAAIAAIAGINPPSWAIGQMRSVFSSAVDRLIGDQRLASLWRRSGRSGTHEYLRPIDPEPYARELRRRDNAPRIAGLILLGWYNRRLLQVMAKGRLPSAPSMRWSACGRPARQAGATR